MGSARIARPIECNGQLLPSAVPGAAPTGSRPHRHRITRTDFRSPLCSGCSPSLPPGELTLSGRIRSFRCRGDLSIESRLTVVQTSPSLRASRRRGDCRLATALKEPPRRAHHSRLNASSSLGWRLRSASSIRHALKIPQRSRRERRQRSVTALSSATAVSQVPYHCLLPIQSWTNEFQDPRNGHLPCGWQQPSGGCTPRRLCHPRLTGPCDRSGRSGQPA